MRRTRSFLIGLLLGVVGCYLAIDWRIGAADAYAKIYATGLLQTADQLQQCQQYRSPWPRKRGPL